MNSSFSRSAAAASGWHRGCASSIRKGAISRRKERAAVFDQFTAMMLLVQGVALAMVAAGFAAHFAARRDVRRDTPSHRRR